MATFSRFEDIRAWQKARELTRAIYGLSKSGAFGKDRALANQIRRASVSIVCNIAEGFERNGNREFIHFLSTAKGSAGEVRAQLYIALDQGYPTPEVFQEPHERVQEVSRQISALRSHLQRASFKGSRFRLQP